MIKPVSSQIIQLVTNLASGSGELGILAGIISKIGIDLLENYKNSGIPKREKDRIELAFDKVFSEIVNRIKRGNELRNDGFIERDDTLRPEADILLEELLNNARNDCSEKKLQLLAKFYANIVFVSGISLDTAIGIINLIDSLNYRQFVLLAIFIENNPENKFGLALNTGKNMDLRLEKYTLVNEIFNISNLNFIKLVYSDLQEIKVTNANQIEAALMKPTRVGQNFYELFSLDEIDRMEFSKVVELLKK